MKQFIVATAVVGAFVSGMVGLAVNAAAAPLGGSSANEAVRTLETSGYAVRINQQTDVPLSACTVTNVSGLRGTEIDSALTDPGALSVAFLDVTCT
jgi:hypothetical protein